MSRCARPSSRLAAVLALGTLAACSLEWDGATASRTTIRSGDNVTISMSSAANSLSMESKGKVRFNQDETDVESLAPNGRFELSAECDGVERSYRVQSDANGNLTRTYWKDGSEQSERDEAWVAESLQRMFRESAFDVEGRTERLLARGGVALVLEEIELVTSDFARATYLCTLFEDHELAHGDYLHALAATAAIDSDFDLARTLGAALERLPDDEAARRAWLTAVSEIDSDFESSRLLQDAMRRESLRVAAASLAAGQIDSDFELSRVHGELVKHAAESGVAAACLDLIQAIDSDFERSRCLTALAPAVGQDAALSKRYRELARDMSEYERGLVLAALDDAMNP